MGRYCQIELGQLIHEVVVSPLSPEWFIQLVQSVASKYGLRSPVRRSSLADVPPQGLQTKPVWARALAVSAWLVHHDPPVTLDTYFVLVPDTLGDIIAVPWQALGEPGTNLVCVTPQARSAILNAVRAAPS